MNRLAASLALAALLAPAAGADELPRPKLALTGHLFGSSRVWFSPDGQRIASKAGAAYQEVLIWDAKTGKRTHTFSPAWTIAFAPKGDLFALVTDKGVSVRDLKTGKEKYSFVEGTATSGYGFPEFSRDGKTLYFYAAFPLTYSVQYALSSRDAATGKNVKKLIAKDDRTLLRSNQLTPDGKHLVGIDYDAPALADPKTRKITARIKGHLWEVRHIALSPDGKTLVSVGTDKTVRVWDVAKRKELRQLKGFTFSLAALAFSPDSKYILTADDDTVRVFAADTGKQVRSYKPFTPVKTADDVYNPTGVSWIEISPDGKRVALGGADRAGVKVWDVADLLPKK
jgi:WD40 repeat protein